MYAPFHSSRAVCTPGRCSGAWSLLFYKKGTCLSRGFHQLFTKEWGEGGFCLPLPSPAFLPPIPPPPFPDGEGGDSKFSYARGFAPCIPGIKPLAALTEPAKQVPGGVCLRRRQFGAKPSEPPFYWQCRQPRRGGDRGRGTSAFEMVLSPGAGRASAAEGQAFPCGHRNRVANHAPLRGLVSGGVGRGEKPGNEHKCRFRETIKNREKFWGVRGTLSRVPRRLSAGRGGINPVCGV